MTADISPMAPQAKDSADAQPRGLAARTLEVQRLVAEHYKTLYRYAYRLSGSVTDAEDLTQQTFLIAQQRLEQVRDPDKTRGWLFAVLRSCYLKSRRKRRPAPAADLDMNMQWIPAEPLVDDIDRERLQQAIDELPDDFKLVVVMFYFQQISYKEIADELGIPIGTVMSRLSRAKSHLRGKLRDSHPDKTEYQQGRPTEMASRL